jgi:hypothetical protein
LGEIAVFFRHPVGKRDPDMLSKNLDSGFGSATLTTGRRNDKNIRIIKSALYYFHG